MAYRDGRDELPYVDDVGSPILLALPLLILIIIIGSILLLCLLPRLGEYGLVQIKLHRLRRRLLIHRRCLYSLRFIVEIADGMVTVALRQNSKRVWNVFETRLRNISVWPNVAFLFFSL